MKREKGTVKWFSTEKGYGFVRREDGDEVFVHHTDIDVEGYATLKNGESVEFEVFDSDRGPKARNLVPLGLDGTTAAAESDSRAERGRASESGGSGRRDRSRKRRDAREKGSGAGGPGGSGTSRTLADVLRERLGSRFPGFRS